MLTETDRTDENAGVIFFCQVVTPRLGFDLSLRQAHRYTGDRVALAGDAAHTVRTLLCCCRRKTAFMEVSSVWVYIAPPFFEV